MRRPRLVDYDGCEIFYAVGKRYLTSEPGHDAEATMQKFLVVAREEFTKEFPGARITIVEDTEGGMSEYFRATGPTLHGRPTEWIDKGECWAVWHRIFARSKEWEVDNTFEVVNPKTGETVTVTFSEFRGMPEPSEPGEYSQWDRLMMEMPGWAWKEIHDSRTGVDEWGYPDQWLIWTACVKLIGAEAAGKIWFL